MAKKGIVFIVPDYRMGSDLTYDSMTTDVAHTVKWTTENCKNPDGNADRIFISRHSAGGHLAALASLDNHYFHDFKIKTL